MPIASLVAVLWCGECNQSLEAASVSRCNKIALHGSGKIDIAFRDLTYDIVYAFVLFFFVRMAEISRISDAQDLLNIVLHRLVTLYKWYEWKDN